MPIYSFTAGAEPEDAVKLDDAAARENRGDAG